MLDLINLYAMLWATEIFLELLWNFLNLIPVWAQKYRQQFRKFYELNMGSMLMPLDNSHKAPKFCKRETISQSHAITKQFVWIEYKYQV